MKMKALSKVLWVLVFVFVGSLAVQAASSKDYLYDTKEENGRIVSKVVFLQKDGLLNKEMKYEFSYNDEGKVSEKTAYRWDKRKDNWEPLFSISYKYNSETGEIHSDYGMWDSKKGDFSLNVQKMIIPEADYQTIFS